MAATRKMRVNRIFTGLGLGSDHAWSAVGARAGRRRLARPLLGGREFDAEWSWSIKQWAVLWGPQGLVVLKRGPLTRCSQRLRAGTAMVGQRGSGAEVGTLRTLASLTSCLPFSWLHSARSQRP